jgi:hypothetical protein
MHLNMQANKAMIPVSLVSGDMRANMYIVFYHEQPTSPFVLFKAKSLSIPTRQVKTNPIARLRAPISLSLCALDWVESINIFTESAQSLLGMAMHYLQTIRHSPQVCIMAC